MTGAEKQGFFLRRMVSGPGKAGRVASIQFAERNTLITDVLKYAFRQPQGGGGEGLSESR